MERLLLSERETQDVLNMSRKSVSREMAKGRLKPLKIGRLIRFLTSDLMEFVERLKVEQRGENLS